MQSTRKSTVSQGQTYSRLNVLKLRENDFIYDCEVLSWLAGSKHFTTSLEERLCESQTIGLSSVSMVAISDWSIL